MATFSSLLKLTFQDTSENSNTWGDVANTQTFEKLEKAIAGRTLLNVNTGSNITLSSNNGVEDSASKMILELDGSPINDINVIIPNNTKMYIVDGTAITGPNTVNIKTTVSTVSASFSAGQVGVILCDGRNTFIVGQPQTEQIPRGIIVDWSGRLTDIPSGWAFCDGRDGRPDLRDKFIIGARQDGPTSLVSNITGTLLQEGGNKDINLSTAIAGAHTHGGGFTENHTLTIAEIPPHTHGYRASVIGPDPVGLTNDISHIRHLQTDSTGGGQPHRHGIRSDGSHSHTVIGNNLNLPPFFVLAKIIKI